MKDKKLLEMRYDESTLHPLFGGSAETCGFVLQARETPSRAFEAKT